VDPEKIELINVNIYFIAKLILFYFIIQVRMGFIILRFIVAILLSTVFNYDQGDLRNIREFDETALEFPRLLRLRVETCLKCVEYFGPRIKKFPLRPAQKYGAEICVRYSKCHQTNLFHCQTIPKIVGGHGSAQTNSEAGSLVLKNTNTTDQ